MCLRSLAVWEQSGSLNWGLWILFHRLLKKGCEPVNTRETVLIKPKVRLNTGQCLPTHETSSGDSPKAKASLFISNPKHGTLHLNVYNANMYQTLPKLRFYPTLIKAYSLSNKISREDGCTFSYHVIWVGSHLGISYLSDWPCRVSTWIRCLEERKCTHQYNSTYLGRSFGSIA